MTSGGAGGGVVFEVVVVLICCLSAFLLRIGLTRGRPKLPV